MGRQLLEISSVSRAKWKGRPHRRSRQRLLRAKLERKSPLEHRSRHARYSLLPRVPLARNSCRCRHGWPGPHSSQAGYRRSESRCRALRVDLRAMSRRRWSRDGARTATLGSALLQRRCRHGEHHRRRIVHPCADANRSAWTADRTTGIRYSDLRQYEAASRVRSEVPRLAARWEADRRRLPCFTVRPPCSQKSPVTRRSV
jgi:hypothetical protein